MNENGDWDDFYEFRRRQCHQRLYATRMNTNWLGQVERLEINQLVTPPPFKQGFASDGLRRIRGPPGQEVR